MDSRLRDEGVSNPYELADTSYLDEACEVVTELKARQREQNVIAREAGIKNNNVNPLIDRHMDISVIKNLFYDQNVQTVLDENLGRDLFVWRTNFFVKKEGTGDNKWHHDRHFENGDDPIDIFNTDNHFTLLIALTDIDMNAGRIEYLKGTHRPIPGFDRDIPRHFLETPATVQNRVTPLLFERGQFVVFYSSLIHRSLAFGEGEGRISMAARLARVGTNFPSYGASNPAGGAQAEAEPIVYYRESGILAIN